MSSAFDSTKHYPEELVGEPMPTADVVSFSLEDSRSARRDATLKLVFKSNFHLGFGPLRRCREAVPPAIASWEEKTHHDFFQKVFVDRGILARS